MTSRIFLIILFAVSVVLSTGIALGDQSEGDRPLYLEIKGLPANANQNKLFLKAIKLRDGSVAAVLRENADSEVYMDAPSTALLLSGTYLTLSSLQFFQGSVGAYAEETLQLTMKNATSNSTPAASSFPTYPPEHGMAIGYNPDDFSATGPGAESWMGRAFVNIVIIDLIQNACSGPGDNSYVVVESANPRMMALIGAELKLQNDPNFDPNYVVTPHFIAATHLLKGGFTLGQDTVTANLRLVDLAGNVLATSSKTGSLANFWEPIDLAAQALSE